MKGYRTAVLGLLVGIMLAVAGAATPLPGAVLAAAKPDGLIVEYDRIQSLKGDFSYRAFDNRVVVRDTAAGLRAVIEVRDVEQSVFPEFQRVIAGNAEVARRLGPAISGVQEVLGGRLQVQVFLGGTMLLEKASGTIWWGWHKARSMKVRAGGGEAPAPPPVAGGVPILDEAGALTAADRQDLAAALAALRARNGLALGLAFLPEMESAAAREKAPVLRKQLIEAGSLPAVSGLLVFTGARSYFWHRDTRVDALVSWEGIQAAWRTTPDSTPLPRRVLEFTRSLGERMAGGAPVTPPNPPVIPGNPPTNPPTPPVSDADAASLRPPDVAPISVKRGATLAQGSIAPATGGVVDSQDGLVLRFPAGGVKAPLAVRIYAAETSAPPVTIRPLGEPEAAAMKTLCAWDVDLGGEKGLLPKPVDVTIDLKRFQRADGKVPLLAPAETLDGKTWSFVPYRVDGTKLVFQTRHFSPKILGAHPGYWVALGALAAGYVIYYRADELPSICNADAPFVSSGAYSGNKFEICWSVKMPGGDPKTGLKDEAGFNRAVAAARAGGFPIQDTEMDELRRQYLMPPAARQVEEALVFAKAYLKRRGFNEPTLSLPVYIVPSLKEDDGLLFNPYTGRRYILIGGNLDLRGTYRAALHELFHHYQVGYNWIWNGDSAFMEACAALIEREAHRDAEYLKKLPGGLLNSVDNNARMDVYRTTLAGPPYSRSDPKPTQRHGYGLSWFLEYCRDRKNPTNKDQFMVDLMENCSSYAAVDAFKWATGGSAFYLNDYFLTFAEEYVLKGIPTENPYGKLYYPSAPYQVWDNPYRTADTFNFNNLATKELGADMPAMSMQFYKLVAPASKKAKLLVQAPADWFTGTNKRGVFFRESPRDLLVKRYTTLQQKGDTAVAMPFDADRYLYLVDAGKSGAARLWTLEPPTFVMQWAEGALLRASWKVPGAVRRWPELFKGYRVYLAVNGEPKPVLAVDVNEPLPDFPQYRVVIDPAAAKLTPEQKKKGLNIYVTTVLKEGLVTARAADGSLRPLESEPSDPAGLPAGGTVAVTVHEPKPEKVPTNPFEVLDGTPTPGATVTLTYVAQGKPQRQTATTDKMGRVKFTGVPQGVEFTVEIQVGLRRETKKGSLTAEKPDAYLQFGWFGHEVKIGPSVSTPPGAPAPPPK